MQNKTKSELKKYINKGDRCYNNNKYIQAIENYTKAIEIDSNCVEAYIGRGNAYAAMGEYDKAIDDYSKAIQLDPNDADVYSNRGYVYNAMGEYEKAIADCATAIKIDTDHVEAYNNRGNAYANKGEYEKAIADYNKVIQLNPDYAEAYNNRGITYADMGEYEKAISDCSKAIQLDSDYAAAYNNRGNAYADMGEYEKAIADYSKAIQLNPDYEFAYYNRGIAYKNKGEYDKAIDDNSKAIQLNPDNADAYYNRGEAYKNKGEYDKAIADYNKAIQLNPDDADLYNGRGEAYDKIGEHEKAIADYKKASQLNGYWPSLEEYDPGITLQNWQELLADNNVTFHENLKMFKMMLAEGGASTCANLAETYGGNAASYNGLGCGFAERVYQTVNCPLCKDGDKEILFTIPFVGKYIVEKGKRRYEWKLRYELKEALEKMDLSDIDISIQNDDSIKYDKNMILYGPPGTGKTYSTAIYALAICDELDIDSVRSMEYEEVMKRFRDLQIAGRVDFTTFHQSYGYEEFIEGIKPVVDQNKGAIGYTIESGVFKKFCEVARAVKSTSNDTAVKENATPYVFVIDEINRGNISKIFGELITLIEETKRAGSPEAATALLPYSGEPFSVPSNVYIIGTMNTADRSIALMDTALRRRFRFLEMMPDSKVLSGVIVDGLDVAKMLDVINERIAFLFDREHTIGHAFFTGLLKAENRNIRTLGSIFAKSVIPLLQEYFYEDYQKIQLVLGDNAKIFDESKFIKDTKVVASSIFVGSSDDIVDLPEKKFEINQEAFYNIESYLGIAPGLKAE